METYYLEYPPFSVDAIKILTVDEYRRDLPANHHYERVTVGEGGDYPTYEALAEYIYRQNMYRRS